MTPVVAYLGLGSNLGNPVAKIRQALTELQLTPGIQSVTASSLYCSAPVGYANQPDFINAVACIHTSLPPQALLNELLRIEARSGRVRSFQNAPRTLDLDILLYGELSVSEPGLHIPHPRMHERAFVLHPLAELAPDLRLADMPIQQLLAKVADQVLEKVA